MFKPRKEIQIKEIFFFDRIAKKHVFKSKKTFLRV